MRIARRRGIHSLWPSGKNDVHLLRTAIPGLSWSWPIVIITSALAVNWVVLAESQSAVRPLLVLWFLLVCPGMAYIRLLRFESFATELTLAIALSLALDTIVSGSLVYAGAWSTLTGLTVLGCISVIGALAQLVVLFFGGTESDNGI